MKHILAPFDFSDAAQQALNYAASMAKIERLPIKIVHVFRPSPTDILGTSLSNEDVLHQHQSDLGIVIENAKQSFPDIEINSLFLQGFAGAELVELSKEESCTCIVMGNKQGSSLTKIYLGSVSTEVAQNAHCPVFIIPGDFQYEKTQKILYATNDPIVDSVCVKRLVKMVDDLQTELHVLHVCTPDEMSEKDRWLVDIQKLFPNVDMITDEIDAETVIDGILDGFEEIEGDLLVIATKHRSYWEEIFHKSTLKPISMMAEKPLLVLHSN